VIIVAVAVGLSVLSYQYSTGAAARILDIASEEARSNAEIQAQQLSAVLTNKAESISINLEVMADASSIQNQEVGRAIPLFTAAQKSTADITSSYSWLDKDGKLIWASTFSNATTRQQFTGADFSYRQYYSQPRDNLTPYYSTVIESVDGVPKLTISYPIIGRQFSEGETKATFNGVIVAAIEVNTLGRLVQEQLVPDYKSSVGLMDRDGVILHSSSSPQHIGKNVFDPELQANIPPDTKDSFNQLIRESLEGNTGSGDFTSEGRTSTIAYNPVTIRGNEFALMYIVTPHELAGNAAALVEQQRMLNLITVIAIGSAAAGIAGLVFVWNKRLTELVAIKTTELTFANASLIESNRQLQVANTKLGEANEQLQIHDRLQREFVNVAAHELRTPIQPLLAAAELMEPQFQGKEKIEVTRPEIEMILRNAKRLERLSSDILEISRIDSGALKLNKENFSLAYIIAEAVKDAKAQSNFDADRLAIAYYADDIFVHADKEKITEVMTNLLINAIKFTKEGTISISSERASDDSTALIEVRDSGPGIDPEILPKLFGKFVTKSEKGTGIGLYISKKIVEAHGGTIVGGNNQDGPGATFRFTLPLIERDVEGSRATYPGDGAQDV
jgi:signal transduction histidine kinase